MLDSGDKANMEQNWDGCQVFLIPKLIFFTNYAILLIFTILALEQGSANYGPLVRSDLSPILFISIGTKPHHFTDYRLSIFLLQCQSSIFETETIWPTNPKIFTLSSLWENLLGPALGNKPITKFSGYGVLKYLKLLLLNRIKGILFIVPSTFCYPADSNLWSWLRKKSL